MNQKGCSKLKLFCVSYDFLEELFGEEKREEIWAVAKDILMMLFGIFFALFVTDKSCQGLKDQLGKTYKETYV